MPAAEPAPADEGPSEISGHESRVQAGVEIEAAGRNGLPRFQTVWIRDGRTGDRQREIKVAATLDEARAASDVSQAQDAIGNQFPLDREAPGLNPCSLERPAWRPNDIQPLGCLGSGSSSRGFRERSIEQIDRIDEWRVIHGNVLAERYPAVTHSVSTADRSLTVSKHVVG